MVLFWCYQIVMEAPSPVKIRVKTNEYTIKVKPRTHYIFPIVPVCPPPPSPIQSLPLDTDLVNLCFMQIQKH